MVRVSRREVVTAGIGASLLLAPRGALAASGAFREPRLGDIERSVEAVYSRGPRVFVDLWDLKRFSDCTACFEERRSRLHTMNLEQRVLPSVTCTHCAKRADY